MEVPALVSGPVSAHVFQIPSGGRVFIFGDEHVGYENLCAPCGAGNDCADIVTFVRRAVDAARRDPTAKPLDVFMELPYVVKDGPERRRYVRAIDARMAHDPVVFRPKKKTDGSNNNKKTWRMWGGGGEGNAAAVDRAAMMARVLGDSPRYIGVFSQLYREFRDDFYPVDDDAAFAKHNVRFHRCDARHESHVGRLLPFIDPVRFHRYVRTSDQLHEVLRAFLFARDFAGEIGRIFGTREAARVLLHMDAGRPHKVAKQFHALPEGAAKAAVKRYLEDRLEDAVSVARSDLGFDGGPHVLAAAREAQSKARVRPHQDHMLWLRQMRVLHGTFYEAFFPDVMRFAAQLLVMDAYLLCRLLRFGCATPGGVSIVYAGDTHAEYYASFFKDYLGLEPTVCSKLTSHRSLPETSDRCVRLSPPASQCTTFGRHPIAVRPIRTRTKTVAA